MSETQVLGTQFVNCNMHETEAGVERDMLNIHNGIDVYADTIFPMNKEYEETHFNANPNVDDYMHNEFHNQSQRSLHLMCQVHIHLSCLLHKGCQVPITPQTDPQLVVHHQFQSQSDVVHHRHCILDHLII